MPIQYLQMTLASIAYLNLRRLTGATNSFSERLFNLSRRWFTALNGCAIRHWKLGFRWPLMLGEHHVSRRFMPDFPWFFSADLFLSRSDFGGTRILHLRTGQAKVAAHRAGP